MSLSLITRAIKPTTYIVKYMGQLAKRAPSTMSAAFARVRAAGHPIGNTVASATAWVKKNPAGAAILVTSFASVGLDVKQLLDGPTDVVEQADDILKDVAKGNITMTNVLADRASAVSETINLGVSQTSADAIVDAREILSFAKSFFGGEQPAKRAHTLLQGFFEMSKADVSFGYSNLKV